MRLLKLILILYSNFFRAMAARLRKGKKPFSPEISGISFMQQHQLNSLVVPGMQLRNYLIERAAVAQRPPPPANLPTAAPPPGILGAYPIKNSLIFCL